MIVSHLSGVVCYKKKLKLTLSIYIFFDDVQGLGFIAIQSPSWTSAGCVIMWTPLVLEISAETNQKDHGETIELVWDRMTKIKIERFEKYWIRSRRGDGQGDVE